MDAEYHSEPLTQGPAPRVRYGRAFEVQSLEALREAGGDSEGASLLGVATTLNVPEATVRYWSDRSNKVDAAPEVVAFFESPVGLDLLHRIVTASTLVITQLAGGGYRLVGTFLELSGLSRFVAASDGARYQGMQKMEAAVGEFGASERARLAPEMMERSICLVEDETFHRGSTCLVAMEPVSGYLLVEQYAEDRTAATWDRVTSEGLAGLPVTTWQVTSDGALALKKHAAVGLNAVHSPDTFHVQQDVSRATSLPLERQEAVANRAVEQTRQDVQKVRDAAEAQASARRGPGRPVDWARRIEDAEKRLAEVQEVADESTLRKEEVGKARRGISAAYHPFDLTTGAERSTETVTADLEHQFDVIQQAVDEAGLRQRCHDLIAKARRVLPAMCAMIALFHVLVRARVEGLDLAPALERVMLTLLIPAYYLLEVARKSGKAESRDALGQVAQQLLAQAEAREGPLSRTAEDERTRLHRTARQCAQFFQRSSSCVEGRNGVLSLRHHAHHNLSEGKLRASTVIHNFFIRRQDGTTAAERFFGQPSQDLFEYLVRTLPLPPRPASKRPTLH